MRDITRWVAAGSIALAAASLSARASHAQQSPKATADLVLVNGRVFTADPSRPWAQGLAIRGDRVIRVGTTGEILAFADAHTKRIDAGGRVVIPGFNDAHDHLGAPLPGVAFATGDDPVPDPTLRQVLDSLTVIVRRVPAGSWLRTEIDARILDDVHARRDAIDSVAPAHPVILTASTGHGVILNSAALRTLNIRDDAPDPLGGFYERQGAPYPARGHGRITGLLHEYAGWNALRALRSQQAESVLVNAFQRHASRALALGITSIQDMANALDPATTFRVLDAARLPIRVRVIAMPATDSARRLTSEWRRAAPAFTRHERTGEPRVIVSGVKWILDGTGIERLSLLRAPFADRAGWNGQMNFPIDTLRAMLREAVAQRSQPVLHVIGDSAIALRSRPWNQSRRSPHGGNCVLASSTRSGSRLTFALARDGWALWSSRTLRTSPMAPNGCVRGSATHGRASISRSLHSRLMAFRSGSGLTARSILSSIFSSRSRIRTIRVKHSRVSRPCERTRAAARMPNVRSGTREHSHPGSWRTSRFCRSISSRCLTTDCRRR